MSAFARSSFDAAGYLAIRPSYPPVLISRVLKYAGLADTQGPRAQALDLGCGPGQVSVALAQTGKFAGVTAVDPSQGMVSNGIQPANGNVKIDYQIGFSDELPSTPDKSVDLVTAGQAAHWFNHPKTFKELRRVLKPGGAIAYFGYAEFYLPGYPHLSSEISDYSSGTLGPYWERPGRTIVESLFDPVAFPANTPSNDEDSWYIARHGKWELDSFERVKFDIDDVLDGPHKGTKPLGDYSLPAAVDPAYIKHTREPSILKLRWDIHQLEKYLRTWSSANTYNEQHPEKKGVGKGIVSEFVDRLKAGGLGVKGGEEKFEIAWPLGMLLLRKQKGDEQKKAP